jgi:hypothetical protein
MASIDRDAQGPLCGDSQRLLPQVAYLPFIIPSIIPPPTTVHHTPHFPPGVPHISAISGRGSVDKMPAGYLDNWNVPVGRAQQHRIRISKGLGLYIQPICQSAFPRLQESLATAYPSTVNFFFNRLRWMKSLAMLVTRRWNLTNM